MNKVLNLKKKIIIIIILNFYRADFMKIFNCALHKKLIKDGK